MNKQRALAHIEKIAWIKPIAGADNIELVGVLGWQCIAKKGEFQVDDLCVYIEIDSKVPETEAFEFLKSKHYRIKTLKFNKFKDEYGNGVMSQGIAIPTNNFVGLNTIDDYGVGCDVTAQLGITYSNPEDQKRKTINPFAKYDNMKRRHKKLFANKYIKRLMRYKWFRKFMFFLFGKKSDKPLKFPDWIQKTDEERIENLLQYLENCDITWEMTEKIDGTSTTFAMEKPEKKLFRKPKYELIVCSRNIRQQVPEQKCFFGINVYWEIANKYNLQWVLQRIIELYDCDKVILQGETYGENIQKNPYKIKGIDFAAFNLIMIKDGKYEKCSWYGLQTVCDTMFHIPCVPYLGKFQFTPESNMHDFKEMADGNSKLNPNVKREGIVYRNIDNPYMSFKNVSNQYLLHHD